MKPDATKIFEAIALILSARGNGVKVKLLEVTQKATKAS